MEDPTDLGLFFDFKRTYFYPEGVKWEAIWWCQMERQPLESMKTDWAEAWDVTVYVSVSDSRDFRHCTLTTLLSYQEHHDLYGFEKYIFPLL